MTTDAPLTDDEYAYLKQNGLTGRILDEVVSMTEHILSARLDALHAETEGSLSMQTLQRMRTERDAARAEVERMKHIYRCHELGRLEAEAERDALRDAITALADEWEARAMTCCRLTCENCGARYIDPDDLRALLASEAGERP